VVRAAISHTSIFVSLSLIHVFTVTVPSNLFEMQSIGTFEMMIKMWFMGEAICDYVLQQDSVQKLIHSKDLHFDLVIFEAFISECFLGFAHKFKAPFIQTCTYGGGSFMADWVGNPSPYSYVPDEFLGYSDKMNFFERMYNTILSTLKLVGRHLIHVPKQNAVMHKYFNSTDDLPPVWELEYKTSLVLLKSHYSLSYPKPLMPNYVQVGGMHIKPPKALPQVRNVKLISLLLKILTLFSCLFTLCRIAALCIIIIIIILYMCLYPKFSGLSR